MLEIADIEEDVLGEARHPGDGEIGQRLVEADFLVDPRASAHRGRDGMASKAGEVRIDEHQLAIAELAAVSQSGGVVGRIGESVRRAAGGVDEAAKLLGDGDEGSGHRLSVEAGAAEDPRTHAQLGLGREQGLHPGIGAAGDAADDVDVGRLFGARLAGLDAGSDAHDDDDRAGLVRDRAQALRQGAGDAGVADRAADVRHQDWRVERKGVGVGVGGGGDEADHGQGCGADRAGAGGRIRER